MFDLRKMWLSCVDPGHFATMLVNIPKKSREKNLSVIHIQFSDNKPYSFLLPARPHPAFVVLTTKQLSKWSIRKSLVLLKVLKQTLQYMGKVK
jgi:hypothetical protein